MGVYKRLEDVPAERRLEQYEERYDTKDVWAKWATQATETNTSHRYRKLVERTERSWKTHVSERGSHHALAGPSDVNTWAAKILDRCQPLSAYQIYFSKVEAFYTWLQFHTEHPHCYHPVLMAAAQGEPTETIWDAKMERREDNA